MPQDIENIYISIGPGSFTGLRVGLTTAQFMGFSLQKPVHGITTFQAFSCGVETTQNRLVIIETKRSDYYVQMMDKNHKPIGEAQSIDTVAVKNMITDGVIITGDAVERFSDETGMDINVIAQPMINIEKVIKAIQSGALELP